MSEHLRRRLERRLCLLLALTLSLLCSASPVAAQNAPPPNAGDYRAAPPAQRGEYQAAPAQPNVGQPQAPAPAPQQGYPAQPPAPQPYYQPQQPQGYPAPAPGAYPVQPYTQPYPGQPVYQQPYATPTVGFRGQPRPRRGMLITGASILGGSYLLALVVGTALIDNNDDSDLDCRDCRQVGRWLFFPIVGPFVAMSQSHDGDAGLMLLGLTELVGLGLLTGGIILYRSSKRAIDAQGYSWDLGHNRKLSLNVDAGPRSVGPRMRIAF